jgi:resuscitation-promoting factor RpfB
VLAAFIAVPLQTSFAEDQSMPFMRQLSVARIDSQAEIVETQLGVPEQYRGDFRHTSVQAMLAALKIMVDPEDRIIAFPDPRLGVGSAITIYRAPEIMVNDYGQAKKIRSWAPTVHGLLSEQQIDLGQLDQISAPGDAVIRAGQTQQITEITITRVAVTDIFVTETIPFTSKTVDDPTKDRGQSSITTKGVAGVRKKTFQVRRENGVEVSRTLVGTEVISEPVTQVTTRGTKVVVLDQGGASWVCNHDGSNGCPKIYPRFSAAHKTLPLGTRVRVVNPVNGQSIVVTIVDRGPYTGGRVIDLTYDAFKALTNGDPTGVGTIASVRLEKE